MPTILVTNDDGVLAPGLLALKQALEPLGRVMVLAPERNWSARATQDHARAAAREDHAPGRRQRGLCLQRQAPPTAWRWCMGVLLDFPLDLVVAGINNGHNMGNDLTYSGTVACALEATINGIPGIAVSTASLDRSAKCDATVAANGRPSGGHGGASRAGAGPAQRYAAQRQRARRGARATARHGHHAHGRAHLRRRAGAAHRPLRQALLLDLRRAAH